jgi:dTDP-4-amino-4,6-dideoxygalactose transaminase
LAAEYNKALEGHPWLRTPLEPQWATSNYQSYAVQLTHDAPLSRNELMQRMLDQGIATRRGIMLAHREKPFLDNPSGKKLPISEHASDCSILLPLYPGLTPQEQERIVRSLEIAALARV